MAKKRTGWTRHNWTDAERRAAREASTPGEVRALAERLGVTEKAVLGMRTRMRIEAGTVRRNHRWTEEEDAALLSSYGYREVSRLAAEFGVPDNTALYRRAKLRRDLAMVRPRRRWSEEEKAAVRACGSFEEVKRWCEKHGRSSSSAWNFWRYQVKRRDNKT